MIVADASVIVRGLDGAGVSRLMLVEEDVHVPHLADQEVLQALRSQVRRGLASPDSAWDSLRLWQLLGVRRHAAHDLLPRIWALRDNLSAYDATYVALAEALGCPLATGDLRLAGAPGIRCEIVRTRD